MKVVIVVVAIWTWLALYASAQTTLVVSDKTTSQDYTTFITSVQNGVKATGKTCHGLPMASGSNPNPTFLEVNLQSASSKNIIRLGFQRSDLYLEGYADMYKGACRYRIFTDSNSNIKNFLCGNVKQPSGVNNIGYDKRYEKIEGQAKTSRTKFGLGMTKLASRIDKIYGKTKNDDNAYAKNEAEFLLLAIQMVAEATRFKYIEDKIKANIKGEYVPDKRATSLEDYWKKLSEAIAKQTDPKVAFELPKGMLDENGKEWKTDTVNNLKAKYISLLTYVPTCKVKSPIFYFLNYDLSSVITM